MVECPGGCGKPITRRWDGLPLDLTLTPHRCPGPVRDADDAYRRDLAEAIELGVWPWSRRDWERHQAAERERIATQDAEDERLEAERWRPPVRERLTLERIPQSPPPADDHARRPVQGRRWLR